MPVQNGHFDMQLGREWAKSLFGQLRVTTSEPCLHSRSFLEFNSTCGVLLLLHKRAKENRLRESIEPVALIGFSCCCRTRTNVTCATQQVTGDRQRAGACSQHYQSSWLKSKQFAVILTKKVIHKLDAQNGNWKIENFHTHSLIYNYPIR